MEIISRSSSFSEKKAFITSWDLSLIHIYLPYVGEKIARLLPIKEEMHFKAYWDGACSMDKIRKFTPMGMDGFVLGTTLLFGKEKPYDEVLSEIRNNMERGTVHAGTENF